jgi:hypothetical protein
MVCEHVRDQKARVVIHESRQVEPLLPPQQEGKDVGLPELIRLSPLETPHRVLARRPLRSCFNQPGLVQDSPHLRLGNSQRREALEHVADSPRPPLPVLAPRALDRLTLRHRRCARASSTRPFRLRHQGVDATLPVARQPVLHRLRRHPKDPRHLGDGHPALDDLHHHSPSKLHRVRLPSSSPVGPFLPFLSHVHRPFLGGGARGFRRGSDAHQLARGTGATEVIARARLGGRAGLTPLRVLINGEPGLIVLRERRPVALLCFTVSGGRIVELLTVTDPARLAKVGVPTGSASKAH